VHLPVFPLITRALGGLGGLEGLFVNSNEGQIPVDELHLAGLDVFLFDLGKRLAEESGAIRALIIGKFN